VIGDGQIQRGNRLAFFRAARELSTNGAVADRACWVANSTSLLCAVLTRSNSGVDKSICVRSTTPSISDRSKASTSFRAA
jgi:hypothetical protein